MNGIILMRMIESNLLQTGEIYSRARVKIFLETVASVCVSQRHFQK